MVKMYYFSNIFLKNRQLLEALRPQHPLTFNIVNLKLRDLAKIAVFQADYDEIELQKSIIMSFQ